LQVFLLEPRLPVLQIGDQPIMERFVVRYSPSRLFWILAASIFFAEMAVMLLLGALPQASELTETLLDSTLLLLLLFPVLYLNVLRPTKTQFASLQKARASLEESETRFRTLVEQAGDAFELIDQDGRYLDVNIASCMQLGYSREELLQLSLFDVVPELSREQYAANFASPANYQARTFETVHRRKDGTTFPVEVTRSVVQFGDGRQTLALVRDITKRKKAEAERASFEVSVREAQKMEALGTLAGGVAHDFNNILATITGNAELVRQDVGPGHVALESLDEIAKASRRARDLVRQILTFGRRQAIERKVISLAPAVEEAARLLRSTLPAGIHLNVVCEADAPPVLADAIQIEQLILNLCANSWHALKGQEHDAAIGIRLRAAMRGDLRFAVLKVRDNGHGMDEKTRSRMFEPFFTTKPVDEGTGLGLSVVHGIIQEHGAEVEVISAPGEGTTFMIHFPAAQMPEHLAPARAPSADIAPGQGQHVLYVDDDESIVLLMTRLLERKGFRVSGYANPYDALAAVRAAPGQFDLAVTDYNMPGISGLEVAKTLREIRPELPVILASGYITEELKQKAPAAGVRELIYKPNTADDLCEAVARFANAQS